MMSCGRDTDCYFELNKSVDACGLVGFEREPQLPTPGRDTDR